MSLVRPSFSHIFLNRRNICSAVSLPRDLTLIIFRQSFPRTGKAGSLAQNTAMFNQHTISIRVRYTEADPMGYLHHSRYLQYFEMGRVEFLRAAGFSYAELEKQGIFFVVIKAEIKYKSPAR